nr:hypothetical protein [Tanacetum cinerariifolium]
DCPRARAYESCRATRRGRDGRPAAPGSRPAARCSRDAPRPRPRNRFAGRGRQRARPAAPDRPAECVHRPGSAQGNGGNRALHVLTPRLFHLTVSSPAGVQVLKRLFSRYPATAI